MVASLLFSQLAVASYVCPDVDAATSSAKSAHAADAEDCPHLGREFPSLCHAHCEPVSQSAHTAQVPAVQAFIPAGMTVVICDADAIVFRTLERRAPLLKRTMAPPVAIRNCCFRI